MSVIINLVKLIFLLFHYQLIKCCFSILCNPNESSALLGFKHTITSETNAYACSQDKLPGIDKWLKGTDCCSWDGISCDALTGHVIGLDLSCRPLSVSVSSNSTIFLLSHLQRFNLAYTPFSSPLSWPSSGFGSFTSLTYLNLSTCGLDGQVPSDLYRLSNLVSLDLSGNGLEINEFGEFVAKLTKLKELDLSQVRLSSISPESMLNLSSSMRSLRLSECSLQGKLSPGDFSRFQSLQLLDLSKNDDLGVNMTVGGNWPSSLRSINLYGTNSSGELLEYSIANLKLLEYLDLSFNHLFGSIPESFGSLKSLQYMSLQNNNFSGSVPCTIGNLKQLNYLDLSSNHFAGQIPDCFANLSKLGFLDLGFNNFSGSLPSSMSKLTQLYSLDISVNMLNGSIPSWLFSLPLLGGFELDYNNLTGPIEPFQNPNHSSLKSVSMSHNQIRGPIPISFFQLSNLTDLDLSSNKLNTIDWSMFRELVNLESIDLSKNPQLSLTANGDLNFSLHSLRKLIISSCSLTEFPYFLGTQQSLTALDLSNSGIRGRISKHNPNGWKSLQYLNLSGNFLTGLDQEPWNSKIQTLDLSFNWLQGQLPVPPPSIQQFTISNNRLRGAVPSSICSLSSIQVLDLSNNALSGFIPKCLGNLMDWLVVLDLRNNNFSGKFPSLSGNSSSLVYLNLHGNKFEGPLPPSLGNCIELRVLDLGNNHINDTFPHWLEALPNLEILILRSNSFHGEIGNPGIENPFPRIHILDLSRNHFTGFLPIKHMQRLKSSIDDDGYVDQLFSPDHNYFDLDAPLISLIIKRNGVELRKILAILTVFDCSSNEFEGEIPKEVGLLKYLVLLNFSHNSLTGGIPMSFSNLTNVESLDLSSNKLVGKIPSQLTLLTFLQVFDLSYNQLKGEIPQGKQFNTFTNDSYMGNPGLCGFPLSLRCNNGKPLPLSPILEEEEDDDDSAKWFDWKYALMGYGSGLVFGISMGYIVFATRRPRWFVQIIEARQYIIKRGMKKKRF